jgi:hypothetical protein
MKEGFLRMRTGLLTAVAIAAVAFSGVAQASVLTETFTGLINSGTDGVGAFGVAGASLAGDAATFSFSYDTGLLQADVNAGTDGSQVASSPTIYDEYIDYAGDSAIAESITINSQTLTIANTSSNPYNGAIEGCTAVCGGNGLFIAFAQIGSGVYLETQLSTTQNYSTSDNLLSQTEFDALVGGGITTGAIYINIGSAQDDLAIGNVNAQPSATPEPTTSISLALGFGMVGLVKRRRAAR